MAAAGVAILLEVLGIVADDVGRDGVDILVVVAVLGSLLQQHLTDVLAALEVLGQHVEQLLGGELLLAVDDRVDGGHGVSGVADADGEGAGLTVAGAAALQGLALLHAVVDEHGREHHGLTHGVQGADDVEAANHQIHEVVDLGVERLLQLLEGVQLGELAGLGAELLAVDGGRERVAAAHPIQF